MHCASQPHSYLGSNQPCRGLLQELPVRSRHDILFAALLLVSQFICKGVDLVQRRYWEKYKSMEILNSILQVYSHDGPKPHEDMAHPPDALHDHGTVSH